MHFRLLCLLTLCAVALECHAQTPFSSSLPPAPQSDLVFLLNSTIIVNGLLAEIAEKDKRAAKKVRVYKSVDSVINTTTPDLSAYLQRLSSSGLIDISLAKRVRSQSIHRLGRQLGLRGPLVFALNSYPLDPQTVAAVRIAPAAIGQIHIIQPSLQARETRVDIWLVPPAKPDPSRYPPGTIFIR